MENILIYLIGAIIVLLIVLLFILWKVFKLMESNNASVLDIITKSVNVLSAACEKEGVRITGNITVLNSEIKNQLIKDSEELNKTIVKGNKNLIDTLNTVTNLE